MFEESADNPDPSLEEVLDVFPTVDDLEKYLKGVNVIPETDYINRCGNCQKEMLPEDKYCRYCGTKKGEGSFLPFRNEMYAVYGPPIKTKYKCGFCGKIWVGHPTGIDYSDFCPYCGKEKPDLLEHREGYFFLRTIGTEDPFSPENRPILFTEEQTLKLLDAREKDNNLSENDKFNKYCLDDNCLREIILSTGADIQKPGPKYPQPYTEKEGEQINLALTILTKISGRNVYGHGKTKCPICGSKIVAGFRHQIFNKNYKVIADNLHAPAEEDALFYSQKRGNRFSEPEADRKTLKPAYLCLCCENGFGEFSIPEGI